MSQAVIRNLQVVEPVEPVADEEAQREEPPAQLVQLLSRVRPNQAVPLTPPEGRVLAGRVEAEAEVAAAVSPGAVGLILLLTEHIGVVVPVVVEEVQPGICGRRRLPLLLMLLRVMMVMALQGGVEPAVAASQSGLPVLTHVDHGVRGRRGLVLMLMMVVLILLLLCLCLNYGRRIVLLVSVFLTLLEKQGTNKYL